MDISKDIAGDGHEARKNKKKQRFREVIEENDSGHFETFTKIDKKMNEDDASNIIKCLMSHFFFSNLSNEEM